MRCGREPGGRHAGRLGICIASVESRLHGIHGGTNAGRCCWLVAGTFCGGEVQGTFADKYASCTECRFYRSVHAQEGATARQTDAILGYCMASDTEARERYSHAIGNLVDRSVAPLAISRPSADAEGEERPITALFSDLAGFSRISWQLGNIPLTRFLDEYFSAMTEILKAAGGTIDKYVGDALVGMFGAPVANPDHALAAAQASLRMISRLHEMRDGWKRQGLWCADAWALRARIGLSSGLAEVGFFGSRELVSYTMTGASVNMASWLEHACKHYGTSILVSEATQELIAHKMLLRRIARVRPKGAAKTTCIYELIGQHGCVDPEVERAVRFFDEAQNLYDDRRWADAGRLLREVVRLRRGEDIPAARLLARCERHEAAPKAPPIPCDDVEPAVVAEAKRRRRRGGGEGGGE